MVRVRIGRAHRRRVAERCRSRRDAVLPTLAWAPEGWGREGANRPPSRTSAGLRWLGGEGVPTTVKPPRHVRGENCCCFNPVVYLITPLP